jgi:hypothetical protein
VETRVGGQLERPRCGKRQQNFRRYPAAQTAVAWLPMRIVACLSLFTHLPPCTLTTAAPRPRMPRTTCSASVVLLVAAGLPFVYGAALGENLRRAWPCAFASPPHLAPGRSQVRTESGVLTMAHLFNLLLRCWPICDASGKTRMCISLGASRDIQKYGSTATQASALSREVHSHSTVRHGVRGRIQH